MSDTLQVAYRVYRPNRTAHAAILWTGDNLDEARRFIRDVLGEDAGGYCRFYDLTWDDPDPALDKVFQFYDGDDREVDPGRWIVVEIGPPVEEREAEILTAAEFEGAYVASAEVVYFGVDRAVVDVAVDRAAASAAAGTSDGFALADDVIARLVGRPETPSDAFLRAEAAASVRLDGETQVIDGPDSVDGTESVPE